MQGRVLAWRKLIGKGALPRSLRRFRAWCTIRSHASLGGLVTAELPSLYRLANAAVACALYLRKLVWPVDLSVFYLHPGRLAGGGGRRQRAARAGRNGGGGVAGAAPSVFDRGLAVVSGNAGAGDRPGAGARTGAGRPICLCARRSASLSWWCGRRLNGSALARPDTLRDIRWLCKSEVGLRQRPWPGCVVMTSLQLRHWRDSVTLLRARSRWNRQLRCAGHAGQRPVRAAPARRRAAQYQAALRLRPDYPEAWERAGVALTEQGRPADALPYLVKAVQLAPAWPEAQRRLGARLAASGTDTEAGRPIRSSCR